MMKATSNCKPVELDELAQEWNNINWNKIERNVGDLRILSIFFALIFITLHHKIYCMDFLLLYSVDIFYFS